jgi:hypothetical protein
MKYALYASLFSLADLLWFHGAIRCKLGNSTTSFCQSPSYKVQFTMSSLQVVVLVIYPLARLLKKLCRAQIANTTLHMLSTFILIAVCKTRNLELIIPKVFSTTFHARDNL